MNEDAERYGCWMIHFVDIETIPSVCNEVFIF